MNNITYFQTIMIFLGTVLSGTMAGAVAAIATRKKTKAEAHKADAEGDKADIEATEIITHTVTDFMTKAMAHAEQREKNSYRRNQETTGTSGASSDYGQLSD